KAEDGIRDRNVTGVQTYALPICLGRGRRTHWIDCRIGIVPQGDPVCRDRQQVGTHPGVESRGSAGQVDGDLRPARDCPEGARRRESGWSLQIGQEPGLLGFSLESTQAGSTDFPGIQIFEQSRNEELLSSALDDAGTPVRWGTRLIAVLKHGGSGDSSFEALADGPDGLLRIRARWCIGADGAG